MRSAPVAGMHDASQVAPDSDPSAKTPQAQAGQPSQPAQPQPSAQTKPRRGREARVVLPPSKDAEAERFSPRVVAPVLGVALPSDHLEIREPRGFLGTRTTHLAVGWTLVGTGVLSGVAAGTLAWQASQIDVSPASPVSASTTTATSARATHRPERTPEQAQQAQQERADKRAVSALMAGAGLAFLASGGLTLLTAPAPRVGRNTRVGAMMTPSGGYVGVTGKW